VTKKIEATKILTQTRHISSKIQYKPLEIIELCSFMNKHILSGFITTVNFAWFYYSIMAY